MTTATTTQKQLSIYRETTANQPSVGQTVRCKGTTYIVETVTQERIIDGLSCGYPIDDGYRYKLTCRPVGDQAAQDRIERIGELKHRLSILAVGPDDERNRQSHNQQIKDVQSELTNLAS